MKLVAPPQDVLSWQQQYQDLFALAGVSSDAIKDPYHLLAIDCEVGDIYQE